MKLPKNLELIEYKPVTKYDRLNSREEYIGFIALVYNKTNNLYEIHTKSDRWLTSKTDIIDRAKSDYTDLVNKCIKLNNSSVMRKFFGNQVYSLIVTVKSNSHLSIDELENKLIDYLDLRF